MPRGSKNVLLHISEHTTSDIVSSVFHHFFDEIYLIILKFYFFCETVITLTKSELWLIEIMCLWFRLFQLTEKCATTLPIVTLTKSENECSVANHVLSWI